MKNRYKFHLIDRVYIGRYIIYENVLTGQNTITTVLVEF